MAAWFVAGLGAGGVLALLWRLWRLAESDLVAANMRAAAYRRPPPFPRAPGEE